MIFYVIFPARHVSKLLKLVVYLTLKTVVSYFRTTFFTYHPSIWLEVHLLGDFCTWCFFDTMNTIEQILLEKHGLIKAKEGAGEHLESSR